VSQTRVEHGNQPHLRNRGLSKKHGQFETDTFVDMQRSTYLHHISFERETPNWVTESRLEGGVNRANLKFTNLITTTSRVSVRNINESEREGAKQTASE
jgi:hypothetical protein